MIYLTNQEENMNRILVFTNEISWRGISDKIRDKVEWNPYPNKNNPLMECAPGVYLVYDNIDDIKLNQLFEDGSIEHFYILLHTSGRKIKDFDSWQDCCFIKTGKHENNDFDLYKPTFEIIVDQEGNKLERIVKKVFMPIKEAAIELLNECLVPIKPLKKLEESIAYCTLYQKEEYRNDLEEFKKKYETSKSFNEYKEEFEHLKKVFFECQ